MKSGKYHIITLIASLFNSYSAYTTFFKKKKNSVQMSQQCELYILNAIFDCGIPIAIRNYVVG